VRSQPLERTFIHDKELRAKPIVSELAGDQQRTIVDELACRDRDFEAVHAVRCTAFDLDGGVRAVGEAMNDGVQTSVKQRKEDVQHPARLLNQLGPNAELHRLAGRESIPMLG